MPRVTQLLEEIESNLRPADPIWTAFISILLGLKPSNNLGKECGVGSLNSWEEESRQEEKVSGMGFLKPQSPTPVTHFLQEGHTL